MTTTTVAPPIQRPFRLLPALYRWHRRIGLCAAVAVLVWACSGLSHPIMTRLFPSAVAMQPPASDAAPGGLPLAEAMARAGIAELTGARLIGWQDRPYWQVRRPGEHEWRYVDAADGRLVADGDARYAEMLARHYSGEQAAAVRRATLVTAFDGDYAAINRLLPVWRIEFERPDGLRVYVETAPARLAALMDDRKAVFQALFGLLHRWEWLDGAPLLRRLLMSVLLLSAAGAAGLGLVLAWRRPRGGRGTPLRTWHRRLGLLVLGSTFAFTLSGVFHVWAAPDFDPPLRREARFDTATATVPPQRLALGATLVAIDGRAAWWLPPAPIVAGDEHAAHAGHAMPAGATAAARVLDAASGAVLADGERRLAAVIAAELAGLPLQKLREATPVTRFDGEYGFVSKRLPVLRLSYDLPGRPNAYVEPASGVLAARPQPLARIESAAFSWLHKAQWLDGLGKGPRDTLLGLFALLNGGLAVIGLLLWLRRARRPA
ncbi:PepSY domain-containing protein [Chitinimonas koreensis]|uniref:PepSY domain-containing protein n=1 Tax=Chitinimonas koreensis TaxID=356302 RepID=UPI0003FD784A|nr:PepSY domain-containing protein [Chitinimonas koreensis]QNM98324.1 hypothetical protein H9L41_08850 [Chitinimonas koreensis]